MTPHYKFKTTKNNGSYFPIMILLVVMVSAALAFTTPQEPKKYKIEMTLEEINALVYCLEQSNAPAATSNNLIKIIVGQVNPVIQAEQKKIQDSINKAAKKN